MLGCELGGLEALGDILSSCCFKPDTGQTTLATCLSFCMCSIWHQMALGDEPKAHLPPGVVTSAPHFPVLLIAKTYTPAFVSAS